MNGQKRFTIEDIVSVVGVVLVYPAYIIAMTVACCLMLVKQILMYLPENFRSMFPKNSRKAEDYESKEN